MNGRLGLERLEDRVVLSSSAVSGLAELAGQLQAANVERGTDVQAVYEQYRDLQTEKIKRETAIATAELVSISDLAPSVVEVKPGRGPWKEAGPIAVDQADRLPGGGAQRSSSSVYVTLTGSDATATEGGDTATDPGIAIDLPLGVPRRED